MEMRALHMWIYEIQLLVPCRRVFSCVSYAWIVNHRQLVCVPMFSSHVIVSCVLCVADVSREAFGLISKSNFDST